MFPDAEITALNVIVPLDSPMSEGGVLAGDEELAADERERAEAVVGTAIKRANERDATVRTATEERSPADVIVAHAEEHDIEPVVMGSRGRSDLSRVLVGRRCDERRSALAGAGYGDPVIAVRSSAESVRSHAI